MANKSHAFEFLYSDACWVNSIFGTFVKNVFMTHLVFTMKDFVCSGLQFSAVILIKSDGLSIKKQADGNVNKWIYYEVQMYVKYSF